MPKIVHVVGARPNFMKAAPVMDALAERDGLVQRLVHTGQHYDRNMSDLFFSQLGLPRPDVNLGVGSAGHAVQTARIMMKLDEVFSTEAPDLVLVYGDVNSTAAASLVAVKRGIRVGHVEAGLRSFDRSMPEEINRLVTDRLSDLLFTPSPDGDENLLREGVDRARIFQVGNVMIDTLVRLLPRTEGLWTPSEPYVLVTLHRPSNVDRPETLLAVMAGLERIAREARVIFPVHPRTRARLEAIGYRHRAASGLELLEPQGYLEFLALQRRAAAVVSDSGGVQEETTFLGVPCLTLRQNTERPVTVTMGTNILVGGNVEKMVFEVERILAGEGKKGGAPPLWDGKAGRRIADVIAGAFQRK
ncbi:MAG: UDP-N-acetylglucosamine 2-epimerase (non-hydrolyzing) [Thermodesulfobacteriota bacterium]